MENLNVSEIVSNINASERNTSTERKEIDDVTLAIKKANVGVNLEENKLINNVSDNEIKPKNLAKNDLDIENENFISISEAGRFSIAAICALSLHNLFNNKWDEDFCLRCIKFILTNLQLPQRVEPIMLEFIKGNDSHSVIPYIELLNSEPLLQKEGSLQSVLFNLIMLATHDGKYDARWRVLVQHIAQLLHLEPSRIDECERKLINCLLQKTAELSSQEEASAANRKLIAKTKRYSLIGLATVGGAALIGVTGGLAAPLIFGGLTSVIGPAIALPAFGSIIVGSLFGVAGGGLTGYKMHKRVGDIEEFEFHELNPLTDRNFSEMAGTSINTSKELHVTIVISGWIKNTSEENYTKPWSNLLNGREQYYLKYESSYLLELGKAMEYIFSCVASFATQEVLKLTILSGLVTAVAWPAGLLGLASVIDNPWGVCLRRSAQVGKQLAEVLLARSHGSRPVTLLGYSLGARVIFYCLREMSGRRNCEGIIQDVILIGAPCTAQASDWDKFRRVVAGRIINGYCRGDWLLRFLYRTLSVAVDGVAGLQKIELTDPKICNVDLTDIVTGHNDYPERMTDVLAHIGVPLSPLMHPSENVSASKGVSIPEEAELPEEMVFSKENEL